MTAYAVEADLTARLSPAYSAAEFGDSAAIAAVLQKASEVIDYHTVGRAAAVWTDGTDAQKDVLTQATCDQAEFWLEVGEEHDVAGLRGSLVGGRVQMHPVPPVLGPRARRTLQNGGLMWLGAGAR